MKLKLFFKTPDVLDRSLDERWGEALDEEQIEEVTRNLSKWIKYSECVTLEYDSETNTMRVCEV